LSAIEYKWEVRQRNTSRFSIEYEQRDGTPISLVGVTDATLHVYSGDIEVLEKGLNILLPNAIEVFLTVDEILDFGFTLAEYEVIVEFSNGDVNTFVNGPIVVRDGRGPFV